MAVSGEEAALSPLHRAVRGHDLRAIAQLGTHAGTAGQGDVRLELGEGSDLYNSAVPACVPSEGRSRGLLLCAPGGGAGPHRHPGLPPGQGGPAGGQGPGGLHPAHARY